LSRLGKHAQVYGGRVDFEAARAAGSYSILPVCPAKDGIVGKEAFDEAGLEAAQVNKHLGYRRVLAAIQHQASAECGDRRADAPQRLMGGAEQGEVAGLI